MPVTTTLKLSKMMVHVITSAVLHLAVRTYRPATMTQASITMTGSCDFISCAGCMNINACDYDPEATMLECVQISLHVYGCMDASADNYDPSATIESGYCTYNGCTISIACNYDATANSDDGSCEYTSCAGCINPLGCNYDPTAILTGDCTFADTGYDCDGICLEDTDGDGICDPFEVLGCTDTYC